MDLRLALLVVEAGAALRAPAPRLELAHVGQDSGVHEQPEPTEGEQEQAPERVEEADAMRGPGHENPQATENPDPASADSP
jgi:hypothetical protein